MDSFAFTVLVVILTGEGVYLAKEFLVVWRRNPQDVPLLFVLASTFVVSLPPAYYVLWSGRFEVFQFGYPLSTWCFGLILEIGFFVVFIAILRLKRRSLLLESVARSLAQLPRSAQFLVPLALFSGIAYGLLWGTWSTSGYEAAGKYIQNGLSGPELAVNGIQSTIFRSVLFPSVC